METEIYPLRCKDDKKKGIYIDGLKTPRKENGDLNDKRCDVCGSSTGAMAQFITTNYTEDAWVWNKNNYCKFCLLKAVDLINKKILEI